jgi:hypothetical protein
MKLYEQHNAFIKPFLIILLWSIALSFGAYLVIHFIHFISKNDS